MSHDEELRKAWASAFREGKYNHQTYGHRKWRKLLLDTGSGCVVCNRGVPNKRTGKRPKSIRLHAHHLAGTNHHYGVLLCPSCHEIVTIECRRKNPVVTDPEMLVRLIDLIRKRKDGIEVSHQS